MVSILSRASFCAFLFLSLTACVSQKGELGTAANPIKLFFVPSVDAKVIESNSKVFKDFLEKETGYVFEVSVPQSYIAVVESFGTKRADVSALNTFGYLLANKKYGVEARMTVLRNGAPTYQSQFIARADSQVKSIKDIQGKKMAYVDAASATGYLLPAKTLKDKHIEPKETVFAMKHDSVVSMVYQKQVDAGATFYSPKNKDGKIQDARRLVKTQYPDIEEKVKTIDLSIPIPNDPICFRKEIPEPVKLKIIGAFLKFIKSPEGIDAFDKMYNVNGLILAKDSDYDDVRAMLLSLGKTEEELLKK